MMRKFMDCWKELKLFFKKCFAFCLFPQLVLNASVLLLLVLLVLGHARAHFLGVAALQKSNFDKFL